MHFEERELKPYAEPVTEDDLKEGLVYFSVTFFDNDMKIPIMDTLVFVGKRDENFIFQDVYSFSQGVDYDSAIVEESPTFVRCGKFVQCGKSEISSVFEYEKALDVLMECSLRRRGKIET